MPAPTATEEVELFAETNAIPLSCSETGTKEWNFGVLHEQFGDKQVFLLGEIHGSVEIGLASADLFESLVREKGVNTLVMEIGMDTTAGLNEYLETGESGPGTTIDGDMWGQYTDNMFRRSLPMRARALAEEGYELTVVGVDTPQRLAWVNWQLWEAVAQWSDETAKNLVVDTLPAARDMDSYGMFGLETSYVNECEAYYNHIAENLETICANLDEVECEYIEKLAYALWTGSIFLSQDFMMAGRTGQGQQEMMEAMELREVLIKYNFANSIPDDSAVVYAHMGSAHTSKTGWSVTSFLNQEYEVTQSQVYSVTSAYGSGSQIFYGFMPQSVPAEPTVVAGVLESLPEDNYFLAANHPGFDCTGNPFLEKLQFELNVIYGEAWDAFFWHRKLTPDVPEGMWMSLAPKGRFVQDQIERLEIGNRLLGMSLRSKR